MRNEFGLVLINVEDEEEMKFIDRISCGVDILTSDFERHHYYDLYGLNPKLSYSDLDDSFFGKGKNFVARCDCDDWQLHHLVTKAEKISGVDDFFYEDWDYFFHKPVKKSDKTYYKITDYLEDFVYEKDGFTLTVNDVTIKYYCNVTKLRELVDEIITRGE